MRELIENPVYMSYEDIERTYDGKWVYIVNCNYTPTSRLLGGVPVVIADDIFEGREDGLYDQFKTPEYGIKTDRDLVESEPILFRITTGASIDAMFESMGEWENVADA